MLGRSFSLAGKGAPRYHGSTPLEVVAFPLPKPIRKAATIAILEVLALVAFLVTIPAGVSDQWASLPLVLGRSGADGVARPLRAGAWYPEGERDKTDGAGLYPVCAARRIRPSSGGGDRRADLMEYVKHHHAKYYQELQAEKGE